MPWSHGPELARGVVVVHVAEAVERRDDRVVELEEVARRERARDVDAAVAREQRPLARDLLPQRDGRWRR
jgi:hypothetical protein